MSTPATADFRLADRYQQREGSAPLSGIQALVRALLEQRRLDASQGLNTGGFVSGYRGSPLSSLDQELWRQQPLLEKHGIRFQPGVNEEHAATAIWGSQQVNLLPHARVAGVFGLWYGKAPGLDRAGDAIRHANAAGSCPRGGVLLAVGDDHGCSSSTLPSQSELNLKDLCIPVLNPADVQDVLDFSLFGWALSRYAGCWVGLIAVSDIMGSSATVDLGSQRRQLVAPLRDLLERDVNIGKSRPAMEQEALLHGLRLDLAVRFAAENGINRLVADPEDGRLGIVTTGKSYADVRQALEWLGCGSEDEIAAAGIRLLKLGMSWPLEDRKVIGFAAGLDVLLVVEEKRSFIEESVKSLLSGARVRVLGKRGADGEALLPTTGELDVTMVARAIAACAGQSGLNSLCSRERLNRADAIRRELRAVPGQAKTDRLPLFCPGCPHNVSTRVPEGSRAFAGIGCHYMAQWMNRETSCYTQMGGEGANWIGQAPFTSETHAFVNLGDGTYFHSGLLAIRQAVISGVNVTYKILLNDAVAMTGGQPVDGQLTAENLVQQLRAEGIEHVEIVSDDPDALRNIPAPVHHRDELDAVQRRFRDLPGCSVIIYQQPCATELRRRRKRGLVADPDVHVMINDAVCEGCGDCSVQSNCTAVEPLVTKHGVKRRINGTACNKDLSCLEGFCPAFVLVEGATRRKPVDRGAAAQVEATRLPMPALDVDRATNILLAGVGGTGIVTLSALLATAAHMDGLAVKTLDMIGLAQKGGAVFGHVRIAPPDRQISGARIPTAGADLLLACDLVTGASRDALDLADCQHTVGVVNTNSVPTASFVLDQRCDEETAERLERIRNFCSQTSEFNAAMLSERLLGGTTALNVLVLGFAWQQGLIPISLGSLERAIELNGTAVEENLRALQLGRVAAWDPESLDPAVEVSAELARPDASTSSELQAVIDRQVEYLTAYQHVALARRFENLVRRVESAEAAIGRHGFAQAVAESYGRLLAYKDEYEVARLYCDRGWAERIEQTFEPGFRMTYVLAPPALGERKRRFGSWLMLVYRLLGPLKRLRGTPLDPFGYFPERREERWSIRHFEEVVGELIDNLAADNHAIAVQLSMLPQHVRGFGHVKAASRKRWLEQESRLLDEFRRGPTPVVVVDPARRNQEAEP